MDAAPTDRSTVETAIASLQEHLANGDPADAVLRSHCEDALSTLRATYRANPAAFSAEAIEALRELSELLRETGSVPQASTPDSAPGQEISALQAMPSKITEDQKSTDDNEPPKRLSQKELSKKIRREAYLRAKEYRKTDPRQIAMRENLKQQRRDAYQKAKDHGKVLKAERKNAANAKAAVDHDLD